MLLSAACTGQGGFQKVFNLKGMKALHLPVVPSAPAAPRCMELVGCRELTIPDTSVD
jgi:hypothetical protein